MERDGGGDISKAQAVSSMFPSAFYEKADEAPALAFEKAFIDLVLAFKGKEGLVALPFATRSFDDITGTSMAKDTSLFALGYGLVFVFIMVQVRQKSKLHISNAL